MKITVEDNHQLESMGISQEEFLAQLKLLITGTEPIQLVCPATVGDGIIRFEENQLVQYIDRYNNPKQQLEVTKFVPASGAASRMFKDLVVYQEKRVSNEVVDYFFENLSKFPFYKDIENNIDQETLTTLNKLESRLLVLHRLFSDDELAFSCMPKGMVPFHQIDGSVRTAFEEHFREAINNLSDSRNIGLQFTVSLAYRDEIKDLLGQIKKQLGEPPVSLKYTLQSESTDTVAIDLNDEILRDEGNQMIFRPGGHGALISNLNNLHTDLIFIRNIDNIIPVERKKNDLHYDRAMAGFLLMLMDRRNQLIQSLEDDPENESLIQEAMDFIETELKHTSESYNEKEDKRQYIFNQLLRPMRVCGMVKNIGEPGGGPFKVLKDGKTNLQIVESCQINVKDSDQLEIMNASTHFNPVDIVCATRDHNGEKFDLIKFGDVETSFVAMKSYKGQDVKALEWPGLWNGGMFNWITFFVEIPLNDFNPVKIVNDLLRENHLSEKKF